MLKLKVRIIADDPTGYNRLDKKSEKRGIKMTVQGTYIHIPLRVRICTYCDFNKYFIQDQPVDEYLDVLITEMPTAKYRILKTMHVGGGTPTALSINRLKRSLKTIRDTSTITGEYTFEANPDELTKEKVQLLEKYGVKRISMGVQTLKPELLSVLGRTRSTEDIYTSVLNTKNAGIKSISLDLMYHLPKQTIEDFEQSLDLALDMDIQHISSYGLILEPKTQFYNMYRKGLLKLPNRDLGADMYQLLVSKIEQLPFHQYEISNFVLDGHESEHNKVYWFNKEYYGFGAGAGDYVDGERYTNINPVNHYIKTINKEGKAISVPNKPSLTERMEEEMSLGLRLSKGVSNSRFKKEFDQSIESVFGQTINNLKEKELVVKKNDVVALTNRGKVIGNEVFEALLINN